MLGLEPAGVGSTLGYMPPDFLNSREDAMLIWAIAIFAYVLWKDFWGITRAFGGVVGALLHRKLLALFGTGLLYMSALVFAAYRLGWWHASALKVTILWSVGTAIVLVGDAVTRGGPDGTLLVRKILRRVFALTLIVEFVVGVYALPLAVEIPLVLIVILFAGMQALCPYNESISHTARTAIDWVLAAVGLIYVATFVVRVLLDPGGFFTRPRFEELLVPPALTLCFLPLLLVAAWFSRLEQERFRSRLGSG
jgi:hypothetical protein